MSREENVINYYVICNKLKNIIRKGWKDWNVKRDRIESVAEHIFGVQMLAVHELGETIIGDLTLFDISAQEKEKIEHEAVGKILNGLLDGEEIKDLFLEFDAGVSKEAKFAYQCDKLECDLQCKLYDEEGCVDLTKQDNNKVMNDPVVKELLEKGCTWSQMWLDFGQRRYPYDENFKAISNYAKNNNIYVKKI